MKMFSKEWDIKIEMAWVEAHYKSVKRVFGHRMELQPHMTDECLDRITEERYIRDKKIEELEKRLEEDL